MKITGVRTVAVNARMRNWVFVAVYETFDAGPVIELAGKVIEKGYTAVKVVFVPYSEPLMGASHVIRLAELMGKLRRAVGDRSDIMIDFHGRASPDGAVLDW